MLLNHVLGVRLDWFSLACYMQKMIRPHKFILNGLNAQKVATLWWVPHSVFKKPLKIPLLLFSHHELLYDQKNNKFFEFHRGRWVVFSSDSLSLEEVKIAYKSLMDRHLKYSKLQSEGAVFYMKWLGIFLAAAFLILVVIGRKSSLPSVNWLLVVGLAISFLMFFFTIMRQDFRYDNEMWRCIKLGKELEEKYSSIIKSQYFHSIDDAHIYQGLLFGRITPVAILDVIITGAGIFLAVKYHIFIGIGIIFVSILIAIWAANFLIKKIKKVGR